MPKTNWYECISNAGVRPHCVNVKRVSVFLRRPCLQSFGRILRQTETELTKGEPTAVTSHILKNVASVGNWMEGLRPLKRTWIVWVFSRFSVCRPHRRPKRLDGCNQKHPRSRLILSSSKKLKINKSSEISRENVLLCEQRRLKKYNSCSLRYVEMIRGFRDRS